MKQRTQIFATLAAILLLAMLLTACGGNPVTPIASDSGEQSVDSSDIAPTDSLPTDTTPTDTTPKDTTPSDTKPANKYPMRNIDFGTNASRIKLLGRVPVTSNGIVAGCSASGFELKADCTMMVTFNVNNYQYVTTNGNGNLNNCPKSEYTVYVDGVEKEKVIFEEGSGTYTCYLDTAGVHTFRFVRHQYVKNGYTEFTGAQIFGTLLDANDGNSAPYIEFIGDSITCGYGLDSTENPNHFDATKSHSYLVAQALGADYSLVAISGIGYTKSSPQHQVNGVHKNILDFYDKTNYMYSPTETFTPSASQKADLVVINLVSNDAANGGTQAAVKSAVKSLVSKVRAMHGSNVKILFVGGMDMDRNDAANKWVDAACSELGGESASIYQIYVDKDLSAKDAHPSVAAQAAAANKITQFIKTKNLV